MSLFKHCGQTAQEMRRAWLYEKGFERLLCPFVLFYVKTLKDPWIRKWPSSDMQDLSIGLDHGQSTLF